MLIFTQDNNPDNETKASANTRKTLCQYCGNLRKRSSKRADN